MDRFVSHFTLRLDAKGRVSIPAPFRAVLARDGFEGFYCYPALDRPALDAGGNALLGEIEALIARFAPYSEEREQFSTALFGTSEILKIDGEGRVVLTDALKRMPASGTRSPLPVLATSFRSGSRAASARNSRRPPRRSARCKKQLGSRVAAEKPHGARE